MRIDLVDLDLFVLVARNSSVSRGAALAHLSVSAASDRIRKIEQLLGASLFVREPRGVSLTPAGEALFERAAVVLREYGRLREGLAGAGAGASAPAQRRLRMLGNTAALSLYLPAALPAFLAEFPDVQLDIEERPSPLIALELASGEADIGLFSSAVAAKAKDRGLWSLDLAPDDIVLLAPVNAAPWTGVDLNDLGAAFLVGLSRGVPFQDYVEACAERRGIRLNYRMRVREMEALCRMVEAGVGYALVSSLAVHRFIGSMAVRPIRLRERWASRSLTLGLSRASAASAQVRALVERLKTAVPVAA